MSPRPGPGLGRGSGSSQSRPSPRAEGAPAPGLQPHQCRTPVPTAGLPGLRHPGHLPHPLARRGSGPLALSCAGSAAPAGARGLNLPQPPFLPQRKQRCLSGAAPLRTPAAEVRPSSRGGRPGGHAKQAWGLLSWPPKGPAPSRDTPCLVELVALGLEEKRMAGDGAREGGGSERLRPQT